MKTWILQLSSRSLIHALFNGTMFSNKNCQNVFERPTLVVFICQSIAQDKSQTTSPQGGRIYLEQFLMISLTRISRGAQREYTSKPLKHSIVKRVLVVKR